MKICPTEPSIDRSAKNTAREAARAKLAAAGAWRVLDLVPDGAQLLTLEKRMQLGTLPAHARPSEVLVNEERGAVLTFPYVSPSRGCFISQSVRFRFSHCS